MLKKTILATLTGAALLASGASFADPYYKHGRGHGQRDVVVERHFYRPVPRPVVVHTYQAYQPRPVVVERRVVVHQPAPVYYQPAPVYSYHSDGTGLAILAGAVLGGAIAYNIATSH